jgi:hypothetical protein
VTGPKLNEGSFVAGERSGTKASDKLIVRRRRTNKKR